MNAFRYRLKSLVWLALLAMCGVALGPSISRVLLPTAADSMAAHAHHMDMQMPMGAGMDPVAHARMMSGENTDPAAHSHAPNDSSCLLDCCALCAVAASPLASVALFVPRLLPAERVALPPADRSRVTIDRRQRWSNAAPRGPPVLS